MRDIQQCRDNGFAVLRELDDGTYDIAYRLDKHAKTWAEAAKAGVADVE